jgi:CRP-like cAMP-binding protein
MSSHRPEYTRIRLSLAASTVFGELPPSTLDALAAAATLQRFDKPGRVDKPGEAGDKLWYVLEGGLLVYWVSPRGETTLLSAIGPGSFYNTASLVEGARRSSVAQAERGTLLAPIPGTTVRELARRDPDFAQCLSRMLFQRFQATLSFYADTIGAPLPVRLARRLLGQALSVRHQPRVEIELTVSQTALAKILGASRSKLNAELRHLERENVLRLGYGKIYVRDTDRLEKIAGGPVLVF